MPTLPAAKDPRWFRWMGLYALLLWLVLGLHRFALLGHPIEGMLLLRFALLAAAISAVLHILGWIGARMVWAMATAGILTGILFMFGYSFRDMSGWQDLAGFMAFSLFSLGGFALGLISEGIVRLIRWRHSKHSQQ